ncbi:MAG: MFS transporter [Erysipelotrichaceae bacterium]|nr:MFS transporter [Erysipelotrichaceae bacterium]
MTTKQAKLTKQETSWILYDVANSAFTMVLTASIPVFFRALVDGDALENVVNNPLVKLISSGNISAALAGSEQAYEAIKSSLFAAMTVVSTVVVAVLAPILGAIADHRNMKKRLFTLALLLGVCGLLSLGITTNWMAYLLLLFLARIGYSSCNVFYDSMLTDVTTDERMDNVSALGFAWGYIGSCVPFIIGIVLILKAESFGIGTGLATQLSFIITAIWWIAFTIPLLKNVKQVHYRDDKLEVGKIFGRLLETLKKISKNKKLFLYIIAYFCYIDGVYTIISMATTYGSEVGLGQTDMILALLLTQFVAFPFAILTGKLAQKYNPLLLIRGFICIYIFACVFGFFLQYAWQFWVLAVTIGLAQGGIQALSRSYYGKLIPKKESNEYFGFFDIFGKFADFFGPMIMGLSASLLGASKYGILALSALFIIGFVLLMFVQKIAD